MCNTIKRRCGGLGSVRGYSVAECEEAEKKSEGGGWVKEHDRSTTGDRCQMVVNHLTRGPVIFADAIVRAHTRMQSVLSARYKFCKGNIRERERERLLSAEQN